MPLAQPFKEDACRVCGVKAYISFIEPVAHEELDNGPAHFQAWCIDCCPGHVFEHEPGEGLRCKYCFDEPSPDYYYDDYYHYDDC